MIGNTEYGDPGLAQLTAPGIDAKDFARVLKDPRLCGFDKSASINQLSSSVTEAIDEFFDQKKPEDLLVLYFSGHGIRTNSARCTWPSRTPFARACAPLPSRRITCVKPWTRAARSGRS